MRAPFVVAVVVAPLIGCGSNNLLIGAAPLNIAPSELVVPGGTNKREYLGRLVYDSEQKCVAFLNNIVAGQGTVNTVGDMLSGGLSGVAAFVTPLATSHILSGTASIVTGWKDAVNNDVFAKASIANFAAALQRSYFDAIGKYETALEKSDESQLIVSVEAAKIQGIHSSCGLAPAEAAIQATIAPKGGTVAPGVAALPQGAPLPSRGPLLSPALTPPGLGGISQTPYMVPGSPLN